MDSLRKAEEITLSFRPLAEALVEFHKTLADGGIEESHALMWTRDFLGILGQHPEMLEPPMIYPNLDLGKMLREGHWRDEQVVSSPDWNNI